MIVKEKEDDKEKEKEKEKYIDDLVNGNQDEDPDAMEVTPLEGEDRREVDL